MGTCVKVEVQSVVSGRSIIVAVRTVPTLQSTVKNILGPGYLADDDGPIVDPDYKLVDGMKLLWHPSSGSTQHRTATQQNTLTNPSNKPLFSVFRERPVQKLKRA